MWLIVSSTAFWELPRTKTRSVWWLLLQRSGWGRWSWVLPGGVCCCSGVGEGSDSECYLMVSAAGGGVGEATWWCLLLQGGGRRKWPWVLPEGVCCCRQGGRRKWPWVLPEGVCCCRQSDQGQWSGVIPDDVCCCRQGGREKWPWVLPEGGGIEWAQNGWRLSEFFCYFEFSPMLVLQSLWSC